MTLSRSAFGWLAVALSGFVLAGCQVSPASLSAPAPSAAASSPTRHVIEAPVVWGGEARCSAGTGCQIVVAEHEDGKIALHKFEGRSSRLLDRQPVAYHPDSAVWLSDTLVAAAVEATASLDIYRVQEGRLIRLHQAAVGFAPRDVILVKAEAGHYTLLATPYTGTEVSWIEWSEDNRQAATLKKTSWCKAPWHPARVSKAPGIQGEAFVAACLDDRKVVAVSQSDRLSQPKVLATFNAVARYARPSPSGQWLYVALETGSRNARINMDSGELQWVASPLTGAIAVLPLSEELVIWADDSWLYLQRLDSMGKVLETRWLKTAGFSTGLQLLDLDGDGERDLVVLNSANNAIDVIYGPIWEQATERR